MAPLSKEAREKAIKTTNDFITNLNFEKAKDICEPVETLTENLDKYVWGLGLGGIYYNVPKNLLCTDRAKKAILLTYLGGLAKKHKSIN